MGCIDLFDTMWIYEAASLLWEYQSSAQNKQTQIRPDTPVIPEWVCYLSEGATEKRSAAEFPLQHSIAAENERESSKHSRFSLTEASRPMKARQSDAHKASLNLQKEKMKRGRRHTTSLSGLLFHPSELSSPRGHFHNNGPPSPKWELACDYVCQRLVQTPSAMSFSLTQM